MKVRVLVCAYACNPFQGSEEAVGWGWLKAIARECDVTVITAEFHRRDIERAQAGWDIWARSVRFEYCPHRPWHYRPAPLWKRIENSLLKPIVNWAYRLWLRDAFITAKQLASVSHYDLTHQLTYVGFRFPGHLWKLSIPFVWGPLGGIETTPWRLIPAMDLHGMVYHSAHNLVNAAHRRLLLAPRRAVRAAGPGLIAATSGVRQELSRFYGADSRVICEVTAPDIGRPGLAVRVGGEPLLLVWAGQHFARKALPLLLQALAKLPQDVRWRLSIYGSGPKTSLWKRQARRLGVAQRCIWKGRVSRDEVIAGMSRAHVFVTTSLKDLTSTVVLEAMSQSLPVLCPDHCGFSDVVTPNSGVRLPISTPEVFVGGLREAITGLFHDETRRMQLALGARERARRYALDTKALQILAVYDSVIKNHRFTARRSSN